MTDELVPPPPSLRSAILRRRGVTVLEEAEDRVIEFLRKNPRPKALTLDDLEVPPAPSVKERILANRKAQDKK